MLASGVTRGGERLGIEHAAHVVIARAVGWSAAYRARLIIALHRRVAAEHGGDQRDQKHARADHRRYGLPGRPTMRCVPLWSGARSKKRRLSWPHRYFVEMQRRACRFECRAHEIMIADGCAAGRDQNVGAFCVLDFVGEIVSVCLARCRASLAVPPAASTSAAKP